MSKPTILLLLILAVPAVSAGPPDFAGKNELGLHAWLDFQGPNGDNTDILASFGWFVDADLKLGVELQWSLSEDIAPGGKDYRAQQYSFVAEWQFPGEGDLLPYAGAIAGYRNMKFAALDESSLVYGGRLGLRYYLTEAVAVDASLNMLYSNRKVFIVDFETEDSYYYPIIGIRALF